MGIIAVLLYSQGHLGSSFHVPFWVVIACQAMMGLGTLVGRLAHREDHGIEDHPAHADAGILRRNRRLDHAVHRDRLGIPVSTTHTITGCIIGVGAAKRLSAVRWSVAKSIVYAWIITIPAAGLIAAFAISRSGCSAESFSAR